MWDKIKTWFKDSETIFWARLQVFVGAVGALYLAVIADPNVAASIKAVIKPDYMPYYIIGSGLLAEYLRRRRADM